MLPDRVKRAAIIFLIWLSGVLSTLGYVALSGGWYYHVWATGSKYSPAEFQAMVVDRGCEFMSGPDSLVTLNNSGALLRCPRIKLP